MKAKDDQTEQTQLLIEDQLQSMLLLEGDEDDKKGSKKRKHTID